MPAIGHRKRRKELQQAVEALGFELLRIETSKGGHFKAFIRDDAGNEFFAFQSSSCSAASCRALNNFKSDVRRQSNKAKGLL